MSPTLRSETKDGEKPEATVDSGACSADAQAELLLKVADMCDAVTQRLTVQQSREPELRYQLTVPVYMGYNNAKSIADFLCNVTQSTTSTYTATLLRPWKELSSTAFGRKLFRISMFLAGPQGNPGTKTSKGRAQNAQSKQTETLQFWFNAGQLEAVRRAPWCRRLKQVFGPMSQLWTTRPLPKGVH
ncbi:hypothetical protein HPB47_019968 [Ixodes persulcatus]|uniref:Uncharacterized protein n=1 Tax=Ixodes persulcatus TaxID=34615 RepID=A0AC60QHM4_IXOPE|nr:hypothetical protein HPB47_019968 [Ixodes persulcatus]